MLSRRMTGACPRRQVSPGVGMVAVLLAIGVTLALRLAHSEAHGWVPPMVELGQLLRDAALVMPLAAISLWVGAMFARLVSRWAGLDQLDCASRLAMHCVWSLASAAVLALVMAPAGVVYGRFIADPSNQGSLVLGHVARESATVLGVALGLLLVVGIATEAWTRWGRKRQLRYALASGRVVRVMALAALLLTALVPAQPLGPMVAQAATAPCSSANTNRAYDVVAINVTIPFNRWGDRDPNGQVFALRGDESAIKNWHAPLTADPAMDVAGNRRLRPRPLVLRAHAGECVKIIFTNRLNDRQWGGELVNPRASIKVYGPSYDARTSDGSAVGFNADTTVPNKDDAATTAIENRIVYYWRMPNDEGLYMFRDEAALAGSEADGGSIVHGLYGAIVVEPAGSTWTDPRSGAAVYQAASDGVFRRTSVNEGDPYIDADIHPPTGRHFRESVQLSQDEIPDIGFGFNYGAEPEHNRAANRCPDCVGEETSLSSWVYGDPALVKLASGLGPWLPGNTTAPENCGLPGSCWTSNVTHAYNRDPTKIRFAHAGVKETHVFHLHAHQWLAEPRDVGKSGATPGQPSDAALPESQTIDSQTWGPAESYTADLLFGAGSKPGTFGDSTFHCHLYSHFAEGFWALLRVHDVLENGMGTTPDGIKVRALKALPDVTAPPAPTADNPGFPRFIPGKIGWRAPQPPGNVFDNNPSTGARTAATRIVAGKALSASAVALEQKVQSRNYGGGTPKAGAPFRDPCPVGARQVTYNVSVIQRDLVYNEAGWHDTQGRLMVLDKDVAAVLAGTKQPEPLFFRANAGDCVTFNLTNRLPNWLGNDAFQALVQTNMAGGHIHLVKFDVLGSDGSSNGWNYQQAAFTREQTDFNTRVLAGTQSCAVATGCRLPDPVNWDPTTQTTAANLGQTITERWYIDYKLNTVFTHDHHFAAVAQHRGFFGALIAEPKGMDFRNPRTGAYYQPINDAAHGPLCGTACEGNAVGEAMDIIGPGTTDDFREFGLAIQDFVSLTRAGGNPQLREDTFNPPSAPELLPQEDPGVMGISYRNAPFKLRQTKNGSRVDPAYTFSSWVWGDPRTPLLRAYEGDAVRLRLIQGSQEEQHVFNMHGMRWREEPDDPQSPFTNAQAIGISEAFNFEVPQLTCNLTDQDRCRGDLLYGSGATDDLWLGTWGIMRVHGDRQSDLLPLPDNAVQNQFNDPVPSATGNPPNLAGDPGNVCPSDAPERKYQVVALDARLRYNKYGDHDPYGVVYALEVDEQAIRDGTKQPEPLVLRANEGDCVEVQFTNKLSSRLLNHKGASDGDPPLPLEDAAGTPVGLRVSMHPQILNYDYRGSDGATVGYNLDQTIGPGQNMTYRWYAQDVTPGEIGTTNLVDFGDVRGHRHHGLFAALIVEPKGSTWHNPYTGAQYGEINVGVVADIRQPNAPDFREFTTFLQDGLNLRDSAGAIIVDPTDDGMLSDAEDRGEKGYNYRNAPFRRRLGFQPADATSTAPIDGQKLARVFSSKVYGDPQTPIYRAYAGDPVRMRVAQGADKPRQQTFQVNGHAWYAQPHDPGSMLAATEGGLSVNRQLNLHVPSAGGVAAQRGDYRYGSAIGFHHLSGGLWGILRVYAPSTSTTPTTIGPTDDPYAGGHPLMPLETTVTP